MRVSTSFDSIPSPPLQTTTSNAAVVTGDAAHYRETQGLSYRSPSEVESARQMTDL